MRVASGGGLDADGGMPLARTVWPTKVGEYFAVAADTNPRLQAAPFALEGEGAACSEPGACEGALTWVMSMAGENFSAQLRITV